MNRKIFFLFFIFFFINPNLQSAQLTEESSLHASNVMFYSKDKNQTSKIEYFIDKEGVKKRKLKKTGEIID